MSLSNLGMLTATLAAFVGALMPVHAQDYPTKNVTIIVPFPAGGPIDATARLLAQPLSERLGRPFIVENIGGAGTSIGSLKVARAAPDGHTLLLQTLALAATGTLYPQSRLDPAANFSTVMFIASNALVLVGRKDLAPTSLAEMKSWMKANRTKMAHPGVGTTGYLTSVVLARQLGVEIDLVPYRGAGPAMQDTVAGHVDMYIGTPLSVFELVDSGGLKAYGVTAAAPIPKMPSVPSLAREISAELEVLFWTALFAPAGTPKPIIDKLNGVLEQVLASDALVRSFATFDMQSYSKDSRTPEGGDRIFQAEVKRWSTLIRDNNIKAAD